MFNRILGLTIVLFWLTMTGLLVRSELNPHSALLREVPVEHVLRLFYQNAQPNDLQISAEKERIGFVRLQGKKTAEHQGLDFSGRLQIFTSKTTKHRFAWSGGAQFDRQGALEHFDCHLTLNEPEPTRVEISVEVSQNLATLRVFSAEFLQSEQTFTLDQNGANRVMEAFGIEPNLVSRLAPGKTEKPVVHAQQSTFAIRGEKVESYLVSFEQGGQTLCEIQLSSLGQILQVKTLLGYSLAPDDLAP